MFRRSTEHSKYYLVSTVRFWIFFLIIRDDFVKEQVRRTCCILYFLEDGAGREKSGWEEGGEWIKCNNG